MLNLCQPVKAKNSFSTVLSASMRWRYEVIVQRSRSQKPRRQKKTKFMSRANVDTSRKQQPKRTEQVQMQTWGVGRTAVCSAKARLGGQKPNARLSRWRLVGRDFVRSHFLPFTFSFFFVLTLFLHQRVEEWESGRVESALTIVWSFAPLCDNLHTYTYVGMWVCWLVHLRTGKN